MRVQSRVLQSLHNPAHSSLHSLFVTHLQFILQVIEFPVFLGKTDEFLFTSLAIDVGFMPSFLAMNT